MLQKFTVSFADGGGKLPGANQFSELRKVDAHGLHLSSLKKDLERVRSTFWGVNPEHTIMAELTWKADKLGEFGIYGTGKTSDEAIDRALAVFYNIFPSGKIQGEIDHVQDCSL
jgi:hypothetical protein